MRIGYARVSTREQNPNGQADVLQANGCERLFVERASGKHKSRPELDRALAELRAGDTLVVTKLDSNGLTWKRRHVQAPWRAVGLHQPVRSTWPRASSVGVLYRGR